MKLLNEAISRISGNWGVPEPAERVACELDAEEVFEAALIHLCALIEVVPTKINHETLDIGGVLVRLDRTSEPSAPIWYEDLGTGFITPKSALSRQDGPRTLAALLMLILYARDQSDSLVLLPPEMRDRQVGNLCQSTGASERFVRFLLARYPSLAAKVVS